MARYNTTVTKKDGTKVSGYIEDGKSYYDNGTSISAGDSVVDAQGKTWTKGGDTSASSEVAMISNAIAQNNAGIKNAINTAKAQKQSEYIAGDNISALADLQKQMKQQELQRARASALSSLNAEEAKTNQAYEAEIARTNRDNDVALKNYFENVANRGQTYSGSTSQGEIAFNIANKNNINALQTAQANALADIARRRQLAEQGYIDDLQSATNAIDLEVLKNRMEQESNAGTEALKKAQLMAELGDYTGLQALGYNTAGIQENNRLKQEQEQAEQALNKAKLMAQMGDFSGLKALGYDTTALERQWNTDIANTQSLISSRNKETQQKTEEAKTNQTYTQVLSAVQELIPSGGEDYSENLSASRYLLNSDLTGANKIRIMKQANLRPETYVRQMVAEGYSIEDVSAFVDAYTTDESYRESLIKYAYKK